VTKETSFTTFSAVVHQIVHLEEGRVLLQDMVLRFQAVQVRPGSQASHRKEKERKKLFYFLIECVLSFFLEEIRLSVSILFGGFLLRQPILTDIPLKTRVSFLGTAALPTSAVIR